MVLKESLSLLVDGNVIHEAIIISDSRIECFPCVHTYDSLLLIKSLIDKLVKDNILRVFCDYLTVRENGYTIVAIPLRKNLVLLLVSHTALLDFNKIVQEVLRSLRKLGRVQTPLHSDGVSRTKYAETVL
ncbi:MAG: hypothetical protein B6U75_00255 [Desulfurococcales archaeon ex4484_217_1]|nr:MAG: hypothetical protein B6U75_00255 [Desulfurococcales archaeon ex4484_217_1]